MKSFLVALLVLTLVLALVVFSTAACAKLCQSLKESHARLSDLPTSQSQEIAAHLESTWEKGRFWLGLLVHQSTCDAYGRALKQLTAACESGDLSSYLSAKSESEYSLYVLQSTVEVSWEAFF